MALAFAGGRLQERPLARVWPGQRGFFLVDLRLEIPGQFDTTQIRHTPHVNQSNKLHLGSRLKKGFCVADLCSGQRCFIRYVPVS